MIFSKNLLRQLYKKEKNFLKKSYFCPDFVVDVEPLKTGRQLNKIESTQIVIFEMFLNDIEFFKMLFYFMLFSKS